MRIAVGRHATVPVAAPLYSLRQAVVRHWPTLFVFSLPLSIYLVTLAPTFFGLDSAEFSTAAYRLGVPHATGYPLYIMLGKLFTFLPVGDPGYTLNLMSAVFAAGTAAVLYSILLLVTDRRGLSIAMALFFAFSYYVWTSAVIAEVYTLHVFLTALVILNLLNWHRTRENRYIYFAAGCWGLSFGNHMSTVLLGPAVGYSVFASIYSRHFSWKHLLPTGTLFCLGLLTYAYLPWRYLVEATPIVGHFDSTGSFTPVDLASLDGMWWMLSGKEFHLFVFPYNFTESLREFGRYPVWLLGNFLGIGVVLGMVGIIHQIGTNKFQFLFLFLGFATNVVFFVNYGALDKDTMLLPTYLIWSIWMSLGAAHLLDILAEYRSRADSSFGRTAYTVFHAVPWEKAAWVLPVIALVINFSYADMSSNRDISDRYTAVLTSFEENSLVLGWWPDTAPLGYLQLVEGRRPDVQVIDRFLMTREDENALVDRVSWERPVYVFGALPYITQPYNIELVGSTQKIIRPNSTGP